MLKDEYDADALLMTVDGFECDTALDMRKEEKDLMLVLV